MDNDVLSKWANFPGHVQRLNSRGHFKRVNSHGRFQRVNYSGHFFVKSSRHFCPQEVIFCVIFCGHCLGEF